MAACSCCATRAAGWLGGIERADSVALDPHKTLFLPYGTGAVVARDGRHLFDAFSASADYIQPLGETEVGPSPADLSPELTRHFRALRLWLPLQLAGVAAFRAAQSEKIALARYFHARLSELGLGSGPAAAICPSSPSATSRRAATPTRSTSGCSRRIQQEGRVFLSGTRIDGSFRLRCAILSLPHPSRAYRRCLDVLVRGVDAVS